MTSKQISVESPYTSLETAESIRLLHLYRTGRNSISGRLERFSLDSPYCPRFTTLSYVWGSNIQHRKVTINGLEFPVLESVYPILDFICNSAEFKYEPWVWIDSICINQQDMEERASQVKLMGRIYKQSKKTVAWLSAATKETDEAMDFFNFLGKNRDKISNPEPPQFKDIPIEWQDPKKWRLLEVLLQKPWWRRVWTLQEFIIARELSFYCGRKNMTRSRFQASTSAVSICKPPDSLLSSQARENAWNRRRLRHWYEDHRFRDKMGLVALMAYSGDTEATDPRDRIYSVLGLATELDRQMVELPTYDQAVEQVYTGLIRAFIETHKSLDIICFAQIFRRDDSGGLSLPTWVPDWTVRVGSLVVPLMVSQSARSHIGNFRPIKNQDIPRFDVEYAASGNEPPNFSFSQDLRQITCRGVVVDFIDGLGGVVEIDSVHFRGEPLVQSTSATNTASPNQGLDEDRVNLTSAATQLVDLIRCLVLDRADRWLISPAPYARFTKAFKHLSLTGRKSEESLRQRWFFNWFDNNKDLLIGGSTVDELSRMPATASEDEKANTDGGHAFASRLHETTGLREMARRLFSTGKGHIGMAPLKSQKGDMICVLFGCSVPVVLRQDGAHGLFYSFVGECYLHGIMNGEALADKSVKVDDFVII